MEVQPIAVSLDTVALHVADVERSIAFYQQLPGTTLALHRPGQFAELHIGVGSLHLVQLPGSARFHLELETADLDSLHDQLEAAGLQPSRPVQHPWHKTDFRVRDPDGNVLEFSAPYAAPTEPTEGSPAAR